MSVAKDPKFDLLLNARPFNQYIDVVPAARECLSDCARSVLQLIRQHGIRAELSFRPRLEQVEAIRAHLLNLLYQRFSDPTRFVAVSLSGADSWERFGYRANKTVIQGLRSAGLIEFVPGFFDRTAGKGYRTRIRATGKLLEVTSSHGLRPYSIVPPRARSLIQLRTAEKQAIEWPADEKNREEFERMRLSLETINEILAGSFIGLHVPDPTLDQINRCLRRVRPESSWVDFYDRQLYRVFNDGGTTIGGRFYGGWWQGIPRSFRKHIHLAAPGEQPVWGAELDYGSMHPRMLYARVSVQPPANMYGAGSSEARKYAKKGLLTLINASDADAAASALQSWLIKSDVLRWAEDRPGIPRPYRSVTQMLPAGTAKPAEMLAQLSDQHHAIEQFFCKGIGKELMYQESLISERVMLKMIETGTVVLPIHDSFIVPHDKEIRLADAMVTEFLKATGGTAYVVPDSTELDNFIDQLGEEDAKVMAAESLKLAITQERQDNVYWTLRKDWEQITKAAREQREEEEREEAERLKNEAWI